MTLFLDTSAMLAAVVDSGDRQLLLDAVARHAGDVYASALALTEALAAIDRLTEGVVLRADLEDAIRHLWDHLHVVPVDQRCLDDAARLARERPIRLTDAIHLAAALRLPPSIEFATVDPAQLPVAIGLGCTVISS
ncbi:MAG: PIN domain-containing protein [Actinomycetota bacterium]|nr:PIN domain-containing protein [Actinomycetota bacterium]